ncbi:MAG: hypothetical protein Q7T21_14250 [Gallionella sp.]|nr:hypothetical protein [Gallionella sp.]
MQKHETKLPPSITIQPQGNRRRVDALLQLRLDYRSLFNAQLLEDFSRATFSPKKCCNWFLSVPRNCP